MGPRWRYRRMVRICLGPRPLTLADHLVGIAVALAVIAVGLAVLAVLGVVG